MIRMAVALTLCLVLSGMAEAGGANLQSHRAVYDLTLKRSRDGGGISAMTGRLVMEWSGECEGAIVNQRMLTQMTGAGGEQVTSDSTLTTWESSDGLKFRYSSRNQVNGKAAEEIKGNASLEKPGGSGAARFAKPEVKKMALPEGTVFPTEQVIQLVRAAQAGERTRAILLFDGLGADPLYETFSVIGQAEPAAEDREGHKLLSGLRSWPVHLAYFPVRSKPGQAAGTPEFEVAFRLYPNGIFTEIVLDYGDFALAGKLTHLEGLPRPEC